MRLLIGLLSVLALAIPGAAAANPPNLVALDQVSRHPIALFSIPGADAADIYIASKPDRASDGSFLQENIVDADILTDSEIQSGRWSSEDQLNPGTYYVVMFASDFDCAGQPSCLDGYSNMLPIDIPKPAQTYRGAVTVYHYSHTADLTLRVKPLGESLPYKVCWRLKSGMRRCVSGKVNGYSWNSAATGDVSVGLRGMKNRTTFAWYVKGRQVAATTANTIRR